MDQNDTDAELVAAWVRGDAHALAAVYDRYAGALYAFALARTRSAADAADVVQDTFVRAASRVSQLRDPSALRAWLYAIARRQLFDRSRGRTIVNDDETVAALAATGDDPSAELVRDEIRELVWSAADSLNDRDRDLLELHLRHGLEGADLAAVVGVSPAHVYTLVNRVKERMAKAVGALLVARHGRADCDQLAAVLHGWDGRFTLDVRSRVTRHVESCDACDRKRSGLVVPANFAAGAMALPVLLPAALRARTLDSVTTTSGAATGGRGWRHDGFPRAAVRGSRRLATLVGAGVASVLVVAGLAVTTLADRADTAGGADVNGAAVTSVSSLPSVSSAPVGPVAPGATAEPGTAATGDGDDGGDADVEPVTATTLDGVTPNTVAARPPSTPAKDTSSGPGERETEQAPLPTSPAGAPAATVPTGGAAPGNAGATTTTRPPTSGTNPAAAPTTGAPAATVATTVAPSPATTSPPGTAAPTTAAPTTAPPPPASLVLSTGSIDLGASTTTSSFSVKNEGGRTATLSTSSSSTALTVVNGAATIGPGESTTVTVTVNRAALAEGSQTAQVAVSAPGASGGGSVVVTARVERAPTIVSLVRTPTTVRTSTSCGQTLTRVTVEPTDESGIASVSVLWSSDGSFAQRTTLTVDSAGRFWSGMIGSFSATGTANLRIDVSDTRGNAVSASTTVTVVAC